MLWTDLLRKYKNISWEYTSEKYLFNGADVKEVGIKTNINTTTTISLTIPLAGLLNDYQNYKTSEEYFFKCLKFKAIFNNTANF